MHAKFGWSVTYFTRLTRSKLTCLFRLVIMSLNRTRRGFIGEHPCKGGLLIIKSFNRSLTASFFIARIGQVGKPMWQPYTADNSFMVFSETPDLDFQRVKAAYESGVFQNFALGSCQPFIRIRDVREVLAKCENMNERHLKQMVLLEQHIKLQQEKLDKQRKLLKGLQQAVYASC